MVGLSEAAVRQRVQRLTDSGVIQVVAVTDPLQLGFARQAMIGIRVTGALEPVADAARRAGRGRLRRDHRRLLRPAGRGRSARATRDLLELISERIRTIEGVASTETFMYLQLRKQTYSWGVR